MKIDWHFFHGFLGNPSDWEPFVENLVLEGDSFQVHDLFQDFNNFDHPSMAEWTNHFVNDEPRPNGFHRVIVGYSMGGRLAMHLPTTSFDQAFLLSAQPGLLESTEQRAQWEGQWLQLAKTVTPQEWLESWNRLPIFANDRVRPERSFTQSELIQQCQMMQAWSVAKQGMKIDYFMKNREKVSWACGADDTKYKEWKKKISDWLPSSSLNVFEEAGHGVIFDQPDLVSDWIRQGVGRV